MVTVVHVEGKLNLPVALNLAGKQSEAADLLKHLAENAVTENRYDKLHVILERKLQIYFFFTDLVMLATTTGSCARLVWKLQKRSVMVHVHVHVYIHVHVCIQGSSVRND
jgi:hypothetical protein